MPKTVALGLDVTVAVEERDGYFAATTKPFAITVYDDTEMGAEKRALDAVRFLLDNHGKTIEELSDYLNRLNVKYIIRTSVQDERIPRPTRECKQELRVKVPAGV